MPELTDIVEGAVKKMDSKLECSICMDSCKQPKLLPCYHIFCKSPCLERLVVQDLQGKSLTCPICRYLVRLTDNGVDGLQTDFFMDHLFEISKTLKTVTESQEKSCGKCKKFPASDFCRDCGKLVCQRCTEIHETWDEYTDHTIMGLKEVLVDPTKLLPLKKQVPRCKKHSKMSLKIFCNTCSELICSHCTIGLHKDHGCNLVEDVFSKHKEEIVSSLQPMKESLNRVNKALKAFDTQAGEINNRRAKVEADINREIDQLHQILDQHRVDLIGSLDLLCQQGLLSLATQRDEVQLLQVKMESCLNYVEAGLEIGTEGEVMVMKGPLLQRVEQILTEFDPDTIQPRSEADIELVTDRLDNIRQTRQEFGEVANLGSVSLKKSYTTGYSLENCKATTGERTRVDITPSPQSLHEPAREIGGLSGPRGTTINSKGQIIVTEFGKSCISVLTREGDKIRTFGSKGSGQGQFSWPCGVAVDGDDNVYVVDGGNYCIQKFTPEGKFIATVSNKGNKNLQFSNPTGICFNQWDNNLYVCDRFNHRIQVLSTDLSFVKCFGSKGSENGQFQQPAYAAFDDANNLYVTDLKNNRVQVLTTDGHFLRAFKNKAGGEQLEKPFAIAIDSSNTVYVSEDDRHCVTEFTAQGDYITSFGSKGKNKVQFSNIWGLTVDQDNSIIVSDRGNNRLQIF